MDILDRVCYHYYDLRYSVSRPTGNDGILDVIC
jgi:hypothetical protein